MSQPTGPNRPLRDLARYDSVSIIATVEKILAEPHHVLSVPSSDLLGLATDRQLSSFVKSRLDKAHSTLKALENVFTGGGFGGSAGGGPFNSGEASMRTAARAIAAVLGHAGKMAAAAYTLSQTTALFSAFEFSRPVLSLTEKERGLLRAMAHMGADNRVTPQRWKRFIALLVWNDGSTIVTPSSSVARVPEIAVWLREFLKAFLPNHEQFLAEAGTECAAAVNQGFVHPAVSAALSSGAKWMDLGDIKSRKVYTTTRSPASLFLGFLDNAGSPTPIYFDRHESLITIAPPGTGKSQGHVINNLLHFPGSAIVLDVKGELYQATAEYRSKHFGPVYRFSPTDTSGNTHRYNPLDFIRTDPDGAANDLSVFSYQVVVDNPKLHDPYWEAKGRDFVWAFGMISCLLLEGEERKVESLYEALSLQTSKDPDSPIMGCAETMIGLGTEHKIPDLVSAGNALKSGLQAGEHSHRIESVLDTARRHLAGFSRSSHARHALSASDWRPETFREVPGSTLYICLDSNELKAYGAIVRLILAQHALRLLQTQVKPDDVPITFFLDELPQLGNFDFVQLLQDLGRSSGLRVWMFAQSMSKLAQAFGRENYRGIIGNCLVRCFMRPDDEAAELLSKPIGEVHNPFSGERRPLATVSDLMGAAYGDKIIVTTSGDTPMVLEKQIAVEAFPEKMLRPDTVIRRQPPVGKPQKPE